MPFSNVARSVTDGDESHHLGLQKGLLEEGGWVWVLKGPQECGCRERDWQRQNPGHQEPVDGQVWEERPHPW